MTQEADYLFCLILLLSITSKWPAKPNIHWESLFFKMQEKLNTITGSLIIDVENLARAFHFHCLCIQCELSLHDHRSCPSSRNRAPPSQLLLFWPHFLVIISWLQLYELGLFLRSLCIQEPHQEVWSTQLSLLHVHSPLLLAPTIRARLALFLWFAIPGSLGYLSSRVRPLYFVYALHSNGHDLLLLRGKLFLSQRWDLGNPALSSGRSSLGRSPLQPSWLHWHICGPERDALVLRSSGLLLQRPRASSPSHPDPIGRYSWILCYH